MKHLVMFKYVFLALLSLSLFSELANSSGLGPGLGVTFATNVSNLPSPEEIMKLFEDKYPMIKRIRLYEPNHDMLQALNNSDIEVLIGIKNEDVVRLASDRDEAVQWVNEYIVPYESYIMFRAIVVGDKLIVNSSLAPSVAPAINNLKGALLDINLTMSVSIVLTPSVLQPTFPPSAGAFDENLMPTIVSILQLIGGSPLLFDVYPYYIYMADLTYLQNMSLGYALLEPNGAEIIDGDLVYTDMLDALVDALHSAIEKIEVLDKHNFDVIVSETGWPFANGNLFATPFHASRYTSNVVYRALIPAGTPKYPTLRLQIYAHTLFVQDQEVGDEPYFGLYYPNMTAAYPLPFSL